MNAPLRLVSSTAIAIALITTSLLGYTPTIGLAQPPTSRAKQTTTLALKYVPPKPPRQGIPSTRRGAASRGCLAVMKTWADPELNNLMALVPETQEKPSSATKVWAQTVSDRPTFWFYVPYAPNSIASLEFVLNDDQDNTLYKGQVAIPSTPGLVSVQLPPTATLKPDQLYNWFFKVKGKSSACTQAPSSTNSSDPLGEKFDALTPNPMGDNLPTSVHVEGWLQRILPPANLEQRLKHLSPQQQAAFYAENGFWYDAFNILAQEKLGRPNDSGLNGDWQTLFKQGGLEKFATQPLLKCCSAK
jgi:hypothetical protein